MISNPLGNPVVTAPVWVFFVRNSLRVITLKTLSFFKYKTTPSADPAKDKKEGNKQ